MPLGLNRTDLNNGGVSYRNGFPITLPHSFGNAMNILTYSFGNPVTIPITFGNPITLPKIFGNVISPAGDGFELEDGSGVLSLEDGTFILLQEN